MSATQAAGASGLHLYRATPSNVQDLDSGLSDLSSRIEKLESRFKLPLIEPSSAAIAFIPARIKKLSLCKKEMSVEEKEALAQMEADCALALERHKAIFKRDDATEDGKDVAPPATEEPKAKEKQAELALAPIARNASTTRKIARSVVIPSVALKVWQGAAAFAFEDVQNHVEPESSLSSFGKLVGLTKEVPLVQVLPQTSLWTVAADIPLLAATILLSTKVDNAIDNYPLKPLLPPRIQPYEATIKKVAKAASGVALIALCQITGDLTARVAIGAMAYTLKRYISRV